MSCLSKDVHEDPASHGNRKKKSSESFWKQSVLVLKAEKLEQEEDYLPDKGSSALPSKQGNGRRLQVLINTS